MRACNNLGLTEVEEDCAMSMTVSSDPENQEHYSVHLLMGTKRGKKWLVKFSSSAFFFFFSIPRQDLPRI